MHEHRHALVSGLAGSVLEIGAGNGLNLPHYPIGVRHVVALEPDPFLLTQGRRRVNHCVARVSFVMGEADHLPLADESVDAVVCSLVLCSVPSVQRALSEVQRVLRRDGQLRFFEHVVATSAGKRRLQRVLAPIWSRLAGDCTLTRDTEQEMRDCGFEVERCTTFEYRPTFTAVLTSPHITGTARRSRTSPALASR
jgi:ubiquinone/menaquinone biosynthesis C-methylase UbiE